MTPDEQRDAAAQKRDYYNKVAQTVVDRAQEMIRSGIPIEVAFRLCIAWELDVQINAGMAAVHIYYQQQNNNDRTTNP